MPFEFSGAPPALLGSGTNSSSPFALLAEQNARPTTTSSSPKSPFLPGFGSGTHFPRPPAFPSANAGFSSTPRPACSFGSSTPPLSILSPPCTSSAPATATSSLAEHQDSVPSDSISKALFRAVNGKGALFNKDEVAADSILKHLLDADEDEKPDVNALLDEFRKVQGESPAVTTFMQAMFAELVRQKTSEVAQPRLKEEKAEDDADREIEVFCLQDDDFTEVKCCVPGCHGPRGEGFDSIEAWHLHFWSYHQAFWAQYKAAKGSRPNDLVTSFSGDTETASDNGNGPGDEYSTIPSIPRQNWRTKEVVRDMAKKLRRTGYVGYEEGSKVLAGLIIDKFYDNEKTDATVRFAMSILGRDSHGDYIALRDIADRASEDLNRAEDDYADEPDADEPEERTSAEREGSCCSSRYSDLITTSQAEQFVAGISPQTAVATSEKSVFRFLELPAEMRNIVYRELLAPGYIGLFDAKHRKQPTWIRQTACKTQILRVSKQTYKEGKDILYEENTVCLSANLAVGNIMPIIHQYLVPDHILSRLTSIVLVCQVQKLADPIVKAEIAKIHWKQLQAMTKLKHIRICMVERQDHAQSKKLVLEQIIERIPKECKRAYEAREGFEDDYVQMVIDDLDDQNKSSPIRPFADAREVDGDAIEVLAVGLVQKQGCKSGDTRDYRFPERALPKLKPLVDTAAINPSMILGGGGK